MTSHRVFISHTSSDKETAREIAGGFRELGWDVWLDEEAIRPGERFQDAINSAIKAADVFVVVVSEASQHSPWARRELSEIIKRSWADESAVVLPVIIGSAEPPGYLRDQAALRVWPEQLPESFYTQLRDLVEQPVTRGVGRTAEGEMRLDDALAGIEKAAASMAEDEEQA